jgi:hypothetical protein
LLVWRFILLSWKHLLQQQEKEGRAQSNARLFEQAIGQAVGEEGKEDSCS